MFFRNIKILLLVTLYSVFLSLLFSESFLSDFQEIRRSILVDVQNKKTETLLIPKSTWDAFSDHHEFKYKGNYYDVKSFLCEKETVKITAIKDSFEIILKTITKNSTSKNKKNHFSNSKKTTDFYFSKIPSFDLFSNTPIVNNNYYYPFHFQSKYLFSLFHPPLLD